MAAWIVHRGFRRSGKLGLLQLSEKVSVVYLEFCEGGCSTSFWKRGSFRSGSNIGSSRSSAGVSGIIRSEEHTSELQSRGHLVCRLLLEKKKQIERESS